MIAPMPSPSRSQPWRLLGLISLGAAVGPLDSAVNIAFPAITGAFHLPLASIQWVVICYVLTYASLLLNCGRLGDVIGHKRVFLCGLGWSAFSLWLCGMAPSFGWLLVFRCLQGIGTAMVFSCAPALVTLAFPEAQRGTALGLYNLLAALASTLGPLLGGQLIALWGWTAVFTFRVPIALLAALLGFLWLRQPARITAGQQFDTPGAVALSSAIISLLLVLQQGNHAGWLALSTLLLSSIAMSSLGFFIWHARHTAEPLIDLRLFQHRAFAMANLAHMLMHLATFTVLLLVPYYLLHAYQASALLGGTLLATSPAGAMLAAPLSAWGLSRFTARHVSLVGACLTAAGLLGISSWPSQTTLTHLTSMLALQGFGAGLFQVANMDFVMGSIPRHQQGVAGSLSMLTRTLGVVSGATLGALLFTLLQAHYTARFQAAGAPLATLASQTFILAFQGTLQSAAAVTLLAACLLWRSRVPTSG
ncbi:MAG: MFS transporter [Candidatus Tectimicrobiota bacterium]